MTEIYDTKSPLTVPLICGGYQGGSSSSKCYKYHFNNDTWVQSISLPKAVTYMGFDSNDEWGLGIVYTVHTYVNRA
jgi:hypothetical protein